MYPKMDWSVYRVSSVTMYPAGNLFIPTSHGRLEAILKEPHTKPHRGVALVLHPLPTGGGTMHNKVVFRASSALNESGLITLRINFRGVGQSTGEFDNGRGEIHDARTALDYLEQQYPNDPLTICGFSFGARVGANERNFFETARNVRRDYGAGGSAGMSRVE